MVKKLKLVREMLKKGIPFKEINSDIVTAVIELNDPELACLLIDSTDDIGFVDLQILIDIVTNSTDNYGTKWVDNLIIILNNKPKLIKYEFMDEINKLDYISLNYLNKKIHSKNVEK